MAIGPKNYQRFALNLAVSIRYFSGDVPIQLIYDNLSELEGFTNLFNILTPIDESDCHINGKLAPGLAKLSLYKYLAFDQNLFIDVDSLCIKDITPLLEREVTGFKTEVQGWGDLTTVDYGLSMQWSSGPKICEKYGLSPTDKLPFINSSAQIIRKGKEAERLFKQALSNIKDPIPAKELSTGWGKKMDHRQPDELYMNVALTQLNYDPTFDEGIIYFHLRNNPNPCEMHDIERGYYFIGCYGSLGTNHRRIYSMYDNILHRAIPEVLGCNHVFKIHELMTQKFMIYEPV